MDDTKRVRIVFKDDDILNETQKLEGFNRTWLLLKPQQHTTINDVASHLLHAFQLNDSCPNGLLLTISGFVVPPFESTCILKDNEIIRVRKRRNVLHIEGRSAANELGQLKVAEQQPAKSGVLLLANEEFGKEKNGGYESEGESGDDMLEEVGNPSGVNSNSKNRKRKAAEIVRGSMKKKQRSEAPGDIADSSKGGMLKKRKTLSRKEKETDLSSEEDEESNEKSLKLSETIDLPVTGTKRNAEVQENSKEAGDANIKTKKIPSRSARRKYAKRRWMKEMANIQKKNAVCESEGLRNWKEDNAKASRNKDDQFKGLQKWKKQAATEKTEEDGQPKGLLHYKQSPQKNLFVKGKNRQQRNQNFNFHKHTNQNSDVAEQPNQSDDEHEQSTQNEGIQEQPNQRNVDIQQQPIQTNGNAQEQPYHKDNASEQSNKESDDENEVVPIVIRPGHIRFEPLEKEQTTQPKNAPTDNFRWNGITSKKKGQKWGSENYSFFSENGHKKPEKDRSELLSEKKEIHLHGVIDFDKLPPLPSIPKEGDLIAYRVLELSSCWTPELSDYRVGKVTWYDAKSDQTVLAPVSEYPVVPKKTDQDEDLEQPDNSLYKEDGSLQIDFLSLIDVRIINGASSPVSEIPTVKENSPVTVSPSTNENLQTVIPSPEPGELNGRKETQPPTSENGGTAIWDELSEALSAKKEELSTNKNWGMSPKKVHVPQNAIVVRPPPGNNWGKNGKNIQASHENGGGKQNSGSRAWKRGSALGPTMAILRSKKDTWDGK